jgi:hypothetical protein
MPYLATPGEFERDINRDWRSHRSKRLDLLVEAIAAYIKGPQALPPLQRIRGLLNEWSRQDPKEYRDRGREAGPTLAQELTARLGTKVYSPIPVVDSRAHPEYDPDRWNSAPTVGSTNCYAYACDDPRHHNVPPQVGRLGGIDPDDQGVVFRDHGVRYAVMQDDLFRDSQRRHRLRPLVRLLTEAVPDEVFNIPGHYLIALFVAHDKDYHWVRQDRNGMWSHKKGIGLVTNRDSNGDLIEDPRSCHIWCAEEIARGVFNRIPYRFSTFYYAPKGGVRTGPLGHARRVRSPQDRPAEIRIDRP